MGNGRIERIMVNKDDDPKTVAQNFCVQNNIEKGKQEKLALVIE
jgi:hypothetical protein